VISAVIVTASFVVTLMDFRERSRANAL